MSFNSDFASPVKKQNSAPSSPLKTDCIASAPPSASPLETNDVAYASPSHTYDVDDMPTHENSANNGADMVKEKGNGYDIETMGEKFEEPKEGMSFDSVESLVNFYREYGKKVDFNISKRSSINGNYECMRYVTLICFRSGKSRNLLKPRPVRKTMCQVKVNAKLHDDGKWHVTGVKLDHNHCLSLEKVCLYRSNWEIKPHMKRKLLLNSKAGIRINQSINALAVEANGHENFTFIEKDARNFIDNQRQLNLNCGDTETLQDYFMKC